MNMNLHQRVLYIQSASDSNSNSKTPFSCTMLSFKVNACGLPISNNKRHATAEANVISRSLHSQLSLSDLLSHILYLRRIRRRIRPRKQPPQQIPKHNHNPNNHPTQFQNSNPIPRLRHPPQPCKTALHTFIHTAEPFIRIIEQCMVSCLVVDVYCDAP